MKPTQKETLKQAIIAILIGTLVSFLSALLQLGLEWLSNLNAGAVGSASGAAAYLAQKLRSLA